MKKLIAALLAALLCTCMWMPAMADTVQAPTNFTFDPTDGSYAFQAEDSNAGYYFIRIYPVTNGEETDRYVSSSKRINGKVGEKTGKVDLSSLGWGSYNVRLVTFAASGTDFDSPEAQTLSFMNGVGGVLERPELRVIADGNTAMFNVDWISCANYYAYQYLPVVTFTVYSDEACTEEVASVDVNLSLLPETMDNHPAGGYIWDFKMGGTYCCDLENVELVPNAQLQLPAGSYYVTAQAVSSDPENIASSQPSEAVSFTVTDEDPNGEYTFAVSSLWQNPNLMGVPCAIPGSAEGRVDSAVGQETTAVIQ